MVCAPHLAAAPSTAAARDEEVKQRPLYSPRDVVRGSWAVALVGAVLLWQCLCGVSSARHWKVEDSFSRVLNEPVVFGEKEAVLDLAGVGAWAQDLGVEVEVVYGDPAIVDKWRLVDADGDQQVTAKEFRVAYKLPPEPVAAIFDVADSNGDGQLGFQEFYDFVWLWQRKKGHPGGRSTAQAAPGGGD